MRTYLIAMLMFAIKLFSLILAITTGAYGDRCFIHHFDCGNGKCIPYSWHCDGDNDCGNLNDEVNCAGGKLNPEECLSRHFECTSDNHCIPEMWHCDGEEDCVDGSDEMHCGDDCNNNSCSQKCKSTPEGPQCYCIDGYILDARDNKTCLDIDECTEEGLCNYECINTAGSFKCSCREGYDLVNSTCKAKGDKPLLVYTTLNEIHGMLLPGNDYALIRRTGEISGLDIDPKNMRVYWTEISNKSSIYSIKTDGSDFKTVLSDGLLFPEDIAVDYIANNLYITDSELKQVLVCKIDGSLCTSLHDQNIGKPRSIALDLVEGFVYWSDWGESTTGIYRSGMDGSHRVSLVSSNIAWPKGIAIDRSTNRLYWTDAKLKKIEYMFLNGTSGKVIYSKRDLHPYSVAVFEDTLYWTDWSAFSLESCNKFTGRNVRQLDKEADVHIMGVHVYHPLLTVTVPNPCSSNECSHMCLISPVSGFRCACSYGFELGEDGKTCIAKQISESLFISEGSSIFHILPKTVGKGIITELPLHITTEIIKLSYDRNSHFLFVAAMGPSAIYSVNILSLSMRELVKNYIEMPLDLAFDSRSNNLYWIDKKKGTVEVISIDSHRRSVLVENLTSPRSLAISPEDGIMFIATGGMYSSIMKYDMDGKNKMIVASTPGKPIFLTVNPSPPTLFWADSNSGNIWYANNKNLRSPKILVKETYDILSIAANEDYVYWTTTKRELNFHKANKTHVLELPGQEEGAHIRTVAYNPTILQMGKSECFIGNGGCSYLCLTSPRGRTCACSTEMMLDDDNMSCIDRKWSGRSSFSITLNIDLKPWLRDVEKNYVGNSDKENHHKTCIPHNFTCESYGKNKIRCDGSADCIDDLIKETNS